MAQAYELLDLVDASPEALYDIFEERGWGDGLPLVPPTSARVDAMLEGCGGDPDEVLAVLPPRFGKATRRMVAVNAALAGCKPEYMPVLVAATRALGEKKLNLRGVNATTHPVAPLMIVHGEIAERAGYNSGLGAFGPGNRANATTGRALRLILLHVAGAVPGPGDASTQGGPAKYAYCVAENTAASPWGSFHRSVGVDAASAVTLHCGEAPHNFHDMESRSPVANSRQVRLGDGHAGAEQRHHRAGRVFRGPRSRARRDLRVGRMDAPRRVELSVPDGSPTGAAVPGTIRPPRRGSRGCTAWPTTRCCR